ncbi:ATP-binding protein [Streptomyces sp. NPDC051079]|uniref:ATP-binding protein n=1 Tax=Streptomyces sp. NPDC051079 TaxID=3155043 RepID=UPI00344F2C54
MQFPMQLHEREDGLDTSHAASRRYEDIDQRSGGRMAWTPGAITHSYEQGEGKPADLAGLIPHEIGNLTLSNPPDWGLALGVSAAGFAAKSLPTEESSGMRVREFTRTVMSQWGVATGEEAVVAVAWELAANAIQHALRAQDGKPQQPARAWLGLVRRDEAVICAVTDSSPTPPIPRTLNPMNSHGRGLYLVDRLSSHWGWSQSPSGTKTVWARVPATR